MYYCNRLLIGLNLNFDKILTSWQWCFTERYAPFVLHLEIFLKCKLTLKGSKADFMQNFMSCITIVDFWWSQSWTLIEYWDINCHILWKTFPIYCHVWIFFKNKKGALKQVRVTLRRTNVLHHCNRLLVCLNSTFDELKEF